jgi:hypothetical protein
VVVVPSLRPEGEHPSAVGVVEHLVDHGLGLLLDLARREGQLGDQYLPGLGDHPLLAGGKAALALPDRQVPDDLGYLVDVSRAQLLDVVLEATAPVGGHLGLVLLEDVHDLLDLVLADDRAEANLLRAVDGDHQGQIAIGDPELEVFALLAQELPDAQLFDDCRPVFGMHDRVALTEHRTPSKSLMWDR